MDTVKTFVSDINKQPYVSLEGKIDFDTSALPKIQKIMSRHNSIDDFIKNESLSNKMVIARYLNTGKWEDKPISLTKIDDRTARDWGDMILKDYAGIDTRGLIKVDVGIGAHVDEFALEEKIDDTFRHYLDSERQGSKMKAGRVFQKLQNSYKQSAKKATDKEPWQMTRAEYRKYGSELYNKLGNREYVNTPFHNYSENVPHEYFEESMGKYPNNSVNQAHYRAIKKAIADGKSVPADVLKEYPDLLKNGEHKTGNPNRLVARLDDAIKGDVSTPAEAKAILNNKGIDSFDPSYKLRFAYLLEDPTGRGGVEKSVVLHNLDEHQSFEDDLSKKIFDKPVKNAEPTISVVDASEAGAELSAYGHQKSKYVVSRNKPNKVKSRRNSTAGIGSVR